MTHEETVNQFRKLLLKTRRGGMEDSSSIDGIKACVLLLLHGIWDTQTGSGVVEVHVTWENDLQPAPDSVRGWSTSTSCGYPVVIWGRISVAANSLVWDKNRCTDRDLFTVLELQTSLSVHSWNFNSSFVVDKESLSLHWKFCQKC